jgi:hypothetical protein
MPARASASPTRSIRARRALEAITSAAVEAEIEAPGSGASALGGGGGAGAPEIEDLDSRVTALEEGSGAVPETLVDEVGDHATRISALEAALGVTPPSNDPVALTFSAPGDTNGLLYYLGTDGGQHAFSNPITTGKIAVTATDPWDASGTWDVKNVASRDAAGYFSKGDAPGSFIQFDLGASKRMDVDKFTIMARATGNPDWMPKGYKLQGSQNGTDWTDLFAIAEDFTLLGWAAIGATAAWPVSNTTPWRYLKLLQTQANGDGGNQLTVAELEFYGTLSTV